MQLHSRSTSERGQAVPLFALALAGIVLGVAVVVDTGYAFAQRRAAQNAADFAAMAGTRIVGQKLTGTPAGAGTARNVEDFILAMLAANDAQLVAAKYVDEDGDALGDIVGAGSIPNGTFGVVVEARTNWQPFLLGLIGVTDWAATASATAKTPGQSLGGGIMPVGLQDDVFTNLESCPLTELSPCINQALTSGHLNIPGGFGWLKFGLDGSGGKCDWTESLGMLDDGGCQGSKTFLDSQIGPNPPANTHGCCGPVQQGSSVDLIGSLTGNEWGDLSFYIDNRIPVWVPIWDDANACGNGANACYHIVGFGPIVFTGDNEHAKWLQGAAVEWSCAVPSPYDDRYCAGPEGAFIIDVTGAVKLIR